MKKRAVFLSCLFALFTPFVQGALPSFVTEHRSDLGEFFEFFETGILLFQERGGKRIVETPSFLPTDISQGLIDGSGTLIFAALAEEEDVLFHPFCKHPSKRKKLVRTCKSLFPQSKTFSPARPFLDAMKHFQYKIDLLSLQFTSNQSTDLIRSRYQIFQELVSAFSHLSDTALIMLNDKIAGRTSSKLFIRYLSVKGWSPIYESPAGLIFAKNP